MKFQRYLNSSLKCLAVCCLCFVSCVNHAQNYKLKGELKNAGRKKVFLASYYGDEYTIIDSAEIKNGKFSMPLHKNYLPGLYRVIIGKAHKQASRKSDMNKIDLIYNYEDIHFKATIPVKPDSIIFTKSNENKYYYQLQKENQEYNRKIGMLTPLLHNYPQDNDFYARIKKEFTSVQKEYRQMLNNWANTYPNSYFSKIAKVNIPPNLSPEKGRQAQLTHLKDHFFDNIDFNDTALLRSNIYTHKIIEYISLHRERNLSPGEQEGAFINAVEEILLRAYINDKVYNYVLHYLVDGFEKFKMEKVLNYIAENHLSKAKCSTDDQATLKKRLSAYQKLAVGKTAPEINITTEGKEQFSVPGINHDYILVVFWATWCSHCNNVIPEIHKMYSSDKGTAFEVLSVSLDTNKTAYQTLMKNKQFTWINYCDYQGWDSPIAIKYNVYATPTMFLMDKNRKILAKPITVHELKKAFSALRLETK